LIEIGSNTAEKNSAQTDRQTDTTKIMVTWPWTNTLKWTSAPPIHTVSELKRQISKIVTANLTT